MFFSYFFYKKIYTNFVCNLSLQLYIINFLPAPAGNHVRGLATLRGRAYALLRKKCIFTQIIVCKISIYICLYSAMGVILAQLYNK